MAHLHANSSSGSKAPSTTSTLRAIDALSREETCVSVFQYSPHTLTLQPRQRPASRPHLSRQVTAFVVASHRLAGAPPTPSHSGRRVCEVRTRHRRLCPRSAGGRCQCACLAAVATSRDHTDCRPYSPLSSFSQLIHFPFRGDPKSQHRPCAFPTASHSDPVAAAAASGATETNSSPNTCNTAAILSYGNTNIVFLVGLHGVVQQFEDMMSNTFASGTASRWVAPPKRCEPASRGPSTAASRCGGSSKLSSAFITSSEEDLTSPSIIPESFM